LQQEILMGAAMIVAAMLLLLLVWRVRLLRWPGLAAAVAVLVAAPGLDLLMVPAYPTSYHTSPTGFTAGSVVGGQAVYVRHCQGCHGLTGHGDGPDAPRQAIPPADLTAEHLWDHADGDLFWWVSRGMTGPDGRPTMPGFADRLSEAERWEVIDFLHANAAGAELARTGRWPHDFMAPDMTGTCADGRLVPLSGVRGRPIHIVVEGVDGVAEGGTSPTFVIGDGAPSASTCVVGDPAARPALAITLGLLPDGIAGSQFLVSPEGWLLGHWYQGGAPAPDTLAFVAETLRSICLSSAANRHSDHR
jgi:mono/diheme cytochrome c family protein